MIFMKKDEFINLKNAEGKRLLQKTKFEYASEIINIIKNNPSIYNDLLKDVELTSNEFFNYLSGDVDGNIIIYDYLLDKSKKLVKKKNLKE